MQTVDTSQADRMEADEQMAQQVDISEIRAIKPWPPSAENLLGQECLALLSETFNDPSLLDLEEMAATTSIDGEELNEYFSSLPDFQQVIANLAKAAGLFIKKHAENMRIYIRAMGKNQFVKKNDPLFLVARLTEVVGSQCHSGKNLRNYIVRCFLDLAGQRIAALVADQMYRMKNPREIMHVGRFFQCNKKTHTDPICRTKQNGTYFMRGMLPTVMHGEELADFFDQLEHDYKDYDNPEDLKRENHRLWEEILDLSQNRKIDTGVVELPQFRLVFSSGDDVRVGKNLLNCAYVSFVFREQKQLSKVVQMGQEQSTHLMKTVDPNVAAFSITRGFEGLCFRDTMVKLPVLMDALSMYDQMCNFIYRQLLSLLSPEYLKKVLEDEELVRMEIREQVRIAAEQALLAQQAPRPVTVPPPDPELHAPDEIGCLPSEPGSPAHPHGEPNLLHPKIIGTIPPPPPAEEIAREIALKPLKAKEVKAALDSILGPPVRSRGSHFVYLGLNGKTRVISFHQSQDVYPRTIKICLEDWGVPLEVFAERVGIV